MGVKTFDVKERRTRINVFRIGKLWVFKRYFADNKELFKQLADYYNRKTYRFEFTTVTERDVAIELLEKNGFRACPIEDQSGYLVKLGKFEKYAPVLRNSIDYMETPTERIFLMKDLVAVEEALEFGAEIAEAYKGFF